MKFKLLNTLLFILCFAMIICTNGTKSFAHELKIKHIKINNKIASWGELMSLGVIDYSYLSLEGIPDNLEIRLKINVMSFLYDIDDSSLVQYRYKLIGKDSIWNNINKGKEAIYFNVKPGYYSFVLQEFDGIKVVQEKIFRFKKSSYFDYSLEFDLFLLSLNLLSLGAFYYIIKQVKKAKS